MERIKWIRDNETGHHYVRAIYEVPAHRSITIAGSITKSSVCSAVFTPPLPGESQHKDRSSLGQSAKTADWLVDNDVMAYFA